MNHLAAVESLLSDAANKITAAQFEWSQGSSEQAERFIKAASLCLIHARIHMGSTKIAAE
jgi:hypothetical protein